MLKVKNITLFIMEIIILQQRKALTYEFTEELNDFIYKYYEDNKELFSLLYDTELLEECIKNRWQVLPQEIIAQLIRPYLNMNSYVSLVEEVGYRIDSKINQLVYLFTEYYQELTELRNDKTSYSYSKNYIKIPQ